MPDSYSDAFEGDIPCGARDQKATLRIKLTARGNAPRVAKLRLVKASPVRVPDVNVNITSDGKQWSL